jgi:hypothetical protein
MTDVASITLRDYSKEDAQIDFPVATITAANLDDIRAQVVDFITAMQDTLTGTVVRRRSILHTVPGTGLVPTDPEAQRETRWTIGYVDNSTTLGGLTNPRYSDAFTAHLPTAQLTGNLASHSVYADLADTQIGAFATAFEAVARSPGGGVAHVNYIKHQGKGYK